MNVLVHADDYGVSRGVTDSILRCVDDGVVNSTSVVVNREAFEYGLAEAAKRSSLQLAVHLNLTEGKPVAPLKQVRLLTDDEGMFYHSFLSLWRAYETSSARRKSELKEQVGIEFESQIAKFRAAVGTERMMRCDSHQHFHFIPFVFDVVVDLLSDYPDSFLRLINDTWAVPARDLRRIRVSNVVKYALLKSLSRIYKNRLDREGIKYPEHFVGMLFSGQMSTSVVAGALDKLRNQGKQTGVVEVALHPGRAAKGEEYLWKKYPAYGEFYFSPWRHREAEAVLSDGMKRCLQRYEEKTRR